MSLFKDLLFLHGHILDPRLLDKQTPSYGEGYGNRTANQRAFHTFGSKHGSTLSNESVAAPIDAQTTACCA